MLDWEVGTVSELCSPCGQSRFAFHAYMYSRHSFVCTRPLPKSEQWLTIRTLYFSSGKLLKQQQQQQWWTFDVFELLLDLHPELVLFNISAILVQSKTQTDSTQDTYFDFTVGTVLELNSSTFDWCSVNYNIWNSQSSTVKVSNKSGWGKEEFIRLKREALPLKDSRASHWHKTW